MRRATTFIRQLGLIKRYGLRLPITDELTSERLSWATNDAAGAFGSPLKLALGGLRWYADGLVYGEGNDGLYWTSTVDGTAVDQLHITPTSAGVGNAGPADQAVGKSVRLIKDGTYSQAQFDAIASNTIEIDSITYGYCYNSTTERIWLDRNLGASRVATSSTDTDGYGDLYQWGRYRDGHQVRTSSTTTTLSSSDTPGHGNFIITSVSPNDWRSPQNANLWQGVSGINNPAN